MEKKEKKKKRTKSKELEEKLIENKASFFLKLFKD